MPNALPWLLVFAGLIVAILAYRSAVMKKADLPYKIIMIGPASAGKTVYLASLYRKLRIQSLETGFYLEVDPEQETRLLQYIEQIEDPSKEFPPANALRDWTEWQFACKVKTGVDRLTIANFSYLDFAGERINQLYTQQNGFTDQFRTLLAEANTIIGMLDGQVLLQYMDGKSEAVFHTYLNLILPIMQASNNPVHFIITKWDLLKGKYSLRQIVDKMRKHIAFKNFVDVHSGFATLRLIPVSAVGMDFVEVGPDNQIHKKATGIMDPYFVEMPLACVLHDYFYDKLPPSIKAQVARTGQRSNLGGIQKFMSVFPLLFYYLTKTSLTMSGPLGLSFQIFLDGIYNTGQRPQNATGKHPNDAQNRIAVIKQTVQTFWELMRKLEREFPDSKLLPPNGSHL